MAAFPADVSPSERDVVTELIADVDRRMHLMHTTLIVATGRFRRCPSAARGRAYQAAVAQMDELLDLRLALSCPPRSPVGASR